MSRYIENCDAVEDNLEYSLSILNSAFEASSDGILIVNCEGEVVKFNKKFIEMWHIPDNVSCLMDDKEFLYCVAPQLLEPQKFIKAVEKIYNGSETIESIIEFKNGKIFESYSMPQTIDNSIVGRVWSFRDITKKKRREKELKSSEEKYFTAFMLSPEAIVITTLSDGKFISVNKGFVEMSGYYEEEIIGKSSLEISFWGSKEERDKIAQKLVQNKTIVEYETCFKTKKGALTCLLSASIIELGTIKHVLSVIKDITYKVQEKIYKDILNNALLILNEIDLKSSLKSISLLLKEKGEFEAVGIRIESNSDFPFLVNDGFTKEFLSTENSLLECSGIQSLNELGDPILPCICGKVISENCSFWTNDSSSLNIMVNKPRLKCMEFGYSSIALIPIRMEKVVGLIHLTSLEKNKFTSSMIGYIELLSSYIGVALTKSRDKEIKFELELKLLNTQRMESIGMLASGIANDLNNILFPILGISELLLNEAKTNSMESNSLKQIVDLTKRGSFLVKQILEFGGKPNNKKINISPKVIVEKVLCLIKTTLPKGVSITTDICECDNIYADPTQLYQVIMNLIINASQAVKEKGNITVSLKQVVFESYSLRKGRYMQLRVMDDGIGISKENILKIFDPFFTTKETGTGLGLSVVHGIVKEHLGDISVFSEEGNTSFNVYLPNSKRIMVVDDEKIILTIEKTILEKEGYVVTTFENSIDAITVFKQSPNYFDLVITDRAMPFLDGDQLIREIRSIRKIPIIVCTGLYSTEYEKDLEKLGIKLLTKPVSLNILIETVKESLEGGS